MEVIELGGRRWRILQAGTLEHMIWMDQQVTEAGLTALLKAAPSEGEWTDRIWQAISHSGQTFPLLSGMLIPENLSDDAWTPAEAEKTSAFLKKLTAPEDKARIRALLVSVVLGFFGVAQSFAGLSDSVSAAQPAAPVSVG